MYNSVNQIIKYLEDNPFTTENDINRVVFGFKRGKYTNNEKYAEMLRRGLDSRKIARIKAKVKGCSSSYFYYIPKTIISNKVA